MSAIGVPDLHSLVIRLRRLSRGLPLQHVKAGSLEAAYLHWLAKGVEGIDMQSRKKGHGAFKFVGCAKLAVCQ